MKKCCLVKSNCFFSFIIMLVASLAISCSGNDEFDALNEDPQTRATFDSDAYVTEWVVPAGGVVTLPIDTSYQYTCIIDWGDNTDLTRIFSRKDYNRASHRYATAGSYQIKILGDYPSLRWWENDECKNYLIKIVQWGNINLQTLYNAFMGCPNLVSIPASIPNVKDYSFAFTNCSGLASLPDGLFTNTFAAEDFTSTFDGCTSLRSLPPYLFKDCVNALSFAWTFHNTGLVALPVGLFENCHKAFDFGCVFFSCTQLINLPNDLFSDCTEASSFSGAFWDCSSLTSITSTLFANCKKVEDFSFAFMNCTALTGTTPVSNEGFELWQRAGQTGYPDVIYGGSCFEGCTGLDGYQTNIDKNWK